MNESPYPHHNHDHPNAHPHWKKNTTDTPSSLYAALQDHYLFYNENGGSAATFELYFNLLYSVYSIPNILLPFLGALVFWGRRLMCGVGVCGMCRCLCGEGLWVDQSDRVE